MEHLILHVGPGVTSVVQEDDMGRQTLVPSPLSSETEGPRHGFSQAAPPFMVPLCAPETGDRRAPSPLLIVSLCTAYLHLVEPSDW